MGKENDNEKVKEQRVNKEVCVTYLNKMMAASRELEQLIKDNQVEQCLNTLLPMLQNMKKFINGVQELQRNGIYQELTLPDMYDPLTTFMEIFSRGEVIAAAQLILTSMRPRVEDWQQKLTTPPVVGLVFSKDRAMQLDATLHSFYMRCQDPKLVQMKVLYLATGEQQRQQYQVLQQDYPEVTFVEEKNFKEQALSLQNNHQYVLFLVDDNLFVRDFSIQPMIDALGKYPDTLGFSLRLGWNAVYCYTQCCLQKVPPFEEIENGAIIYDWTQAEYDFGYCLEISSSLYRIADLKILLQQLPFSNPNTLESLLSLQRGRFSDQRRLLCNKFTITFCTPINRVQGVYANDSGRIFSYSIEELSDKFSQGYRIDVEKYKNYLPMACHEEVKLYFVHRIAKEPQQVSDHATVASTRSEVTKVEVINTPKING